MHQTTVTIGRNIGTEMMRARDWTRFANSVSSAVTSLQGAHQHEIHTGTGSWLDRDGTTHYEDSMRISVLHPGPLTAEQTGTLVAILASLALTYGQEAIALATGPVVLITPSRY